MTKSNLSDIKRAQKESQLLREVSSLVLQVSLDESSLSGLYVTRVKLSQDKGTLFVFFTASGGKEEFDEKLRTLVLYKPSMRTALAKNLDFRYTPELMFQYDEISEKQKRIEDLFNKIASQTPSDPHES